MALFDMKKLAVVLALAVSVGACAQKSAKIQMPSFTELQAELDVLREDKAKLEQEEVVLREKENPTISERVSLRAERLRIEKREAEILRQMPRQADKAEREALAQIRKEERVNSRNDRHVAKAVREAAIQGCPPGSVKVKAYGQNLDLFALFPPTVVIRVTNNTDVPVAISTPFKGLGQVAENLCPGGSMNVSFKLDSHDSVQAQFPVFIRTMEGEPYFEKKEYGLDKYMANYQRVKYDSWLFEKR